MVFGGYGNIFCPLEFGKAPKQKQTNSSALNQEFQKSCNF